MASEGYSMKPVFIIGILVAVAIFGLVAFNMGASNTSGFVTLPLLTDNPVGEQANTDIVNLPHNVILEPEPSVCPFECCLGNDYLIKSCQSENLECVDKNNSLFSIVLLHNDPTEKICLPSEGKKTGKFFKYSG